MDEPRHDVELDRDWRGELRANLLVTGFAVFSVGYFLGAAWAVSSATEALGQRQAMAVMGIAVALYAWLLGRLIVKLRRVRGAKAAARWRGVCVACGYDLRGLGKGAVCPECGRSGEPSREDGRRKSEAEVR